jgi:hypothetical protein
MTKAGQAEISLTCLDNQPSKFPWMLRIWSGCTKIGAPANH